MSIQSEIDRIENNIAATYAELEEQGADMPSLLNSDNLAAAAATAKTVKYIPQTLTSAQKTQARSNIGAAAHYYGVCGTAAATAAKTVTVDDGFALTAGAQVTVKFTYANSVASPTLNVNGTGAKPIYRYGTTVASTGTTTTGWVAGAIQTFTYDGTGWIRDYWSNTTYSNASLGQGYVTCSTAETTVAKTAALSSYALTTGGIVAVKFTNDVPAGATLNINSKGAKAIYYNGAAITDGIIKAGDTATFIYSTYYHLISVDNVVYPKYTDNDRDIHVDAIGIKRGSADYAAANSAIMNALMESFVIRDETGKQTGLKQGRTIHFGSGQYYFATPIVCPCHTTFKGVVSNACNIENAVNYGAYLHFPELSDGEAAISLPGGVVQDLGIIGNPSVCDVAIDRTKTGTDPNSIVTLTDTGTTYGIRFDDAWNIIVQNVKVMNFTYGVYTPTGNGLVSGVTAEQCKIAVSVGNDMKVNNVQVWRVMVGVELRGQLASATNIRGDSIGKHLIECQKGKCLLTNIDGDYCVGSLIHYGGGDIGYIHLGQAVACMGRVATRCAYTRSGGFDLRNVADEDYEYCSFISIAPDTKVFGGQIDIVNVAANPMDSSSSYLHPNAAISIGVGSTVKGLIIKCNVPHDADAAYFNANVIKNLSTYAEATNDTVNYLTDFDGSTVEDICFITPSGFLRSVRTTSALDRQIIGSEDVAVLSKKISQIEEVIEPLEVLVPGINLNDGVYEYGRFATAGTEHNDSPNNMAFRNVNYLPVEGGRTIVVYFDKAEWNTNNDWYSVQVVQYDANKNILVARTDVRGYVSGDTLTLNANTAFVRLSVAKWATITTELTDIKLALYYSEDAVTEFVEYGYGAEYTYGVKGSKVSLVSPNGTTYVLSVSDDGILSAVLPVKE